MWNLSTFLFLSVIFVLLFETGAIEPYGPGPFNTNTFEVGSAKKPDPSLAPWHAVVSFPTASPLGGKSADPNASLPVFFFVTGVGATWPALDYTQLFHEISSHGVVVIGVDHDASCFPPARINYTKLADSLDIPLNWIASGNLASLLKDKGAAGVPKTRGLVVGGHSAGGGHLMVRRLTNFTTDAESVIMIDPVDGEGPDPLHLVKQHVIHPPHLINFVLPALHIETGLDPRGDPPCAPHDMANDRFFNAWRGPIWQINVTKLGHMGVTNQDGDCTLSKILCPSCKNKKTLKPIYHQMIGSLVHAFVTKPRDLGVLEGRTPAPLESIYKNKNISQTQTGFGIASIDVHDGSIAHRTRFETGFDLASIDVDDGSIAHRTRFEAWRARYQKAFDSVTEASKAYYGWLSNDQIIQDTNAQNLSYKLGHNEYSHFTQKEFAAKMTMATFHSRDPEELNVDHTLADPARVAAAPASVDWTREGAVTPVKNQGRCGSCWAFSATGAIEGAYAIAGNPLTSLSEQEIVSCDEGNDGCRGGAMYNAFKFVEANGLCTEEAYPYTSGGGITGTCNKSSCTAAVTIKSFTDVPANNEVALKAAVAQQPVSVGIEADQSVFQLYKGGVMDSKRCGDDIDLGVLIVGYGTENGKDYWKVKNAWGPSWGMEGYILIGRGEDICGISQQPNYPTGVSPR